MRLLILLVVVMGVQVTWYYSADHKLGQRISLYVNHTEKQIVRSLCPVTNTSKLCHVLIVATD